MSTGQLKASSMATHTHRQCPLPPARKQHTGNTSLKVNNPLNDH